MTSLEAKVNDILRKNKIQRAVFEDFERYPTAHPAIDFLLGGGLPLGGIVGISGESSYGKSTLAQIIAAHVVRSGDYVIYVDTENAFSPTWATQMGIDENRFVLIQPDYAEQALDQISALIPSGLFKLIVWDSVAATNWKAVMSAGIEDNIIGTPARKWNQWYVKTLKALRESGTCLIMINQIRSKIGVMFGSPETEPGGKGHEFYPSIRIKMLRPTDIKSGSSVVGIQFNARTRKNKTAPSGREVKFDLYTVRGLFGLDIFSGTLDIAGEFGLISNAKGEPKIGSGNYYFNGVKLGKNRAEASYFLSMPENAELFEELKQRLGVQPFNVPLNGNGFGTEGSDNVSALDAEINEDREE